jgi:hypothetical protein
MSQGLQDTDIQAIKAFVFWHLLIVIGQMVLT